MNNCTFIGNLVADAVVNTSRTTGNRFTTFKIAVNRKFKDKEDTQFVSCMLGGENTKLLPCLAKGKKVAIQGRVSCHAYVDKEGKPCAGLDCFVNELELLSSKHEAQKPADPAQSETSAYNPKAEDSAYNPQPSNSFEQPQGYDLPF